MEEFHGLFSLLVACIELVLAINLLVFGGRNSKSYLIAASALLLFIGQLVEFSACYFGYSNTLLTYVAVISFWFFAAALLETAAGMQGFSGKAVKLVYIPLIAYAFYLPLHLESLRISGCTIFHAEYSYPGEYLTIAYFAVCITAALAVLFFGHSKTDEKNKKYFIAVSAGIIAAYLPSAMAVWMAPQLDGLGFSIFSKAALIVLLPLAWYLIMLNNSSKNERPVR